MLQLYLVCLIIGGGFVLLSFFADHDVDVDVDVDADVDVDVDHDMDVDLDAATSLGAADALWLPLLSLRFWVFSTAFFGLTGFLLTQFSGLAVLPTLAVALGVGFLSGYSVSRLVQKLRQEQVNSAIDPHRDYVGQLGEVILDVEVGDPGQVRLHAKGVDVDLPAVVENGDPRLERGTRVVVRAYEAGTLVVASIDAQSPQERQLA